MEQWAWLRLWFGSQGPVAGGSATCIEQAAGLLQNTPELFSEVWLCFFINHFGDIPKEYPLVT